MYFHENWSGRVTQPRFILTFLSGAHSLAFYVCWYDYHWQSENGNTLILTLRNPEWEQSKQLGNLARTMGNATTGTAQGFLRYLQFAHPQLAIGDIPEGEGAAP